MKKISTISLIASLLMVFVIHQFGVAQFDDLYYDPDNDVYEDSYAYADEDYYDDADYDYDDYDYWEEDTYHYTNRIRRFSRPAYGFGYYSPFYTNVYYANPYAPIDPVYYYDYGSPNIYVSLNFGNPYRYYPYTRGYYSPWYRTSGVSIGYNWGNPGRYYSPFGYGSYGRYGGIYGGGFGYGGYGIASALYCPPGYYGSGSSLYNYGYRNSYVNNQNRVYTSRGYKSNGVGTSSASGSRVSPRTSRKAPSYVNGDNNRNKAISSARSTRINNNNQTTTRARIYDSKTRANRIASRTTNNASRINNSRSSSNSRSILNSPNRSRSTGISRGTSRINNRSSINRSSTRSSNIRSSSTRSSTRSSGSKTSSSRSSGRSGNNN